MRCETGCEVECTDEVRGVLGAGEECDGGTAAGGWHGGVCSGGFGEHEGRFEFVLCRGVRYMSCLIGYKIKGDTFPATLKTAPLPALKRGQSVDERQNQFRSREEVRLKSQLCWSKRVKD